MSSVTRCDSCPTRPTTMGRLRARVGHVLRSRIRPRSLAEATQDPAPLKPIVPRMCTVRDDELPLLKALVQESNRLPGPIIEIGTLLGVSTTHMALWKDPAKKIITVDLFSWNPWGLTPEQHRDITTQMLYCLTQTNHVELIVSCKNAFYETYRGEPPALVFLDAMHDYPETAKDIAWRGARASRSSADTTTRLSFPVSSRLLTRPVDPRSLWGRYGGFDNGGFHVTAWRWHRRLGRDHRASGGIALPSHPSECAPIEGVRGRARYER